MQSSHPRPRVCFLPKQISQGKGDVASVKSSKSNGRTSEPRHLPSNIPSVKVVTTLRQLQWMGHPVCTSDMKPPEHAETLPFQEITRSVGELLQEYSPRLHGEKKISHYIWLVGRPGSWQFQLQAEKKGWLWYKCCIISAIWVSSQCRVSFALKLYIFIATMWNFPLCVLVCSRSLMIGRLIGYCKWFSWKRIRGSWWVYESEWVTGKWAERKFYEKLR